MRNCKVGEEMLFMENPKLRGLIKIMIDSLIIILSVVIPFVLKFESNWRINFRQIFTLLYLVIFLSGYFLLRLQYHSWKYSNYRDNVEIIILNVITSVVFFVSIAIFNFRYTITTLPITLVFSIFLQLFVRFLYSSLRYYQMNGEIVEKKRRHLYMEQEKQEYYWQGRHFLIKSFPIRL